MNASAVLAALADRYPSPEWALLSEVRTETGRGDDLRIADALAVNLWPSKKGERHGIEIKVDRVDMRRELRSMQKSEPFRRICSSWWLAVPAPWKRVILSRAEIPEGWGLLEVDRGGVVEVVRAAEREAEEPSPEAFLAFLRAATRTPDGGSAPAGAPTQLVTRPYLARDRVGLACGHVAPKPLAKAKATLLRLPCVACAEGRPTDLELVLAAIDDASAEDLGVITDALSRRGAA